MAAIAQENEQQVREIVAGLLQGLGREPNMSDLVAAETIAATHVRSRRLRERGRDDTRERRQIARLMVTTPFGMVPAPPPVPPKFNPVGPKVPGATYFVVEKGGDPAPDEATVPGEVSNAG
jgi:hypothetical protein